MTEFIKGIIRVSVAIISVCLAVIILWLWLKLIFWVIVGLLGFFIALGIICAIIVAIQWAFDDL